VQDINLPVKKKRDNHSHPDEPPLKMRKTNETSDNVGLGDKYSTINIPNMNKISEMHKILKKQLNEIYDYKIRKDDKKEIK